jgi:hypothetical protein
LAGVVFVEVVEGAVPLVKERTKNVSMALFERSPTVDQITHGPDHIGGNETTPRVESEGPLLDLGGVGMMFAQ